MTGDILGVPQTEALTIERLLAVMAAKTMESARQLYDQLDRARALERWSDVERTLEKLRALGHEEY